MLSLERKFPKKDPLIFRTFPNTTADYLEDKLGIEFSLKPVRVDLTFGNKLRLARAEGLRMGFLFPRGGSILGYYNPEYHAYFARVDSEARGPRAIFVGLHENMHGYITLENTEVAYQTEDLTDAFKWRDGPSTIQPNKLDLKISKTAFEEGMAHWGAYETSKMLTEVFSRDDILDFEYSIRYDYKTGETRNVYVERLRGRLESEFAELIASLSQGSLSASRKAMTAWDNINRMSYLVGYIFVREVMQHQGSRGLSTNEGIDWLIHNPPTTISDILSPSNFIRRN